MTRHIALLRGVNVRGRGIVPMADLRALAAEIGFIDVKTLLQSGNMVFSAPGSPAELEARLEKAIEDRFGRPVMVMVRTLAEWRDLVEGNPMADFAAKRPSHFQVFFMKAPLPPAAFKASLSDYEGSEDLRLDGREIYASFPDGIADSKLMAKPLDKRIGAATTARNWNTVLKLRDAVAG